MVLIAMFCSLQLAHGQKKKRLTREERKLKHYELLSQAVRDTSFSFGTQEITMPFISSGMAGGGYIDIEDQMIRVNEILWVETQTDIKTLKDQIALKRYTYYIAQAPNTSEVKFEGQIQGTKYFFTVNFGVAGKPTMAIKNDKNHTVKYIGRMKTN